LLQFEKKKYPQQFFLESLDPFPKKPFESDTHHKSFKNFRKNFLDTLTIEQSMKALITNHLSI